MPPITPTQAVTTISLRFPHTGQGTQVGTYSSGNARALRGITNLVREIPPELIVLPEDVYADMVLAVGAIQNQLDTWINRGDSLLTSVKGQDPVGLISRALAQCPDEYPPSPTTTEPMFITDDVLRNSIRGDIGAAERAFVNFEWKAATVLAGAAIEALLHWHLDQPPPTAADINRSVTTLLAIRVFQGKPQRSRDYWNLHHFIEVSGDLKIIDH